MFGSLGKGFKNLASSVGLSAIFASVFSGAERRAGEGVGDAIARGMKSKRERWSEARSFARNTLRNHDENALEGLLAHIDRWEKKHEGIRGKAQAAKVLDILTDIHQDLSGRDEQDLLMRTFQRLGLYDDDDFDSRITDFEYSSVQQMFYMAVRAGEPVISFVEAHWDQVCDATKKYRKKVLNILKQVRGRTWKTVAEQEKWLADELDVLTGWLEQHTPPPTPPQLVVRAFGIIPGRAYVFTVVGSGFILVFIWQALTHTP